MTKFGPQADDMQEQVAELARSEGLGYRTDRLVGSTFDAHRLLHLAKQHGVQHELITLLFQANFAQARSLFDRDALQDLATQAGLDADEVRRVPTRSTIPIQARGPPGCTSHPYQLVAFFALKIRTYLRCCSSESRRGWFTSPILCASHGLATMVASPFGVHPVGP